MTQADRDRLVTLKKAKKKVIKQREAAEELGVSVRHIKRLLRRLKEKGDRAVIGVDPKNETASQGTKYIEWSEVWICPELSTVAI